MKYLISLLFFAGGFPALSCELTEEYIQQQQTISYQLFYTYQTCLSHEAEKNHWASVSSCLLDESGTNATECEMLIKTGKYSLIEKHDSYCESVKPSDEQLATKLSELLASNQLQKCFP